MNENRNRALTGGAAALIAAGALSFSAIAPATAAPTDPPVLSDDAGTTTGSASITIDVLANDLAPEGAELDAATLSLVDASGAPVPAIEDDLGTWTVADGQLAFAPADGASGVAEATYTVATTEGISSTGTVTVTVEQSAPVEPAPVEPVPVEPAPVEPAPVEPAPVEPAPEEPSPIDPEPEEPAPIEPAPVEPAPVEPEPTEPAPVEPEPTEPAPVEPEPTEPAPVEPEPTEPAPEEPAPSEPAPEDDVEVELEDDKVAHEFSAESPVATVDVLANDEVEGDAELDATTLALVGEDGEPVQELETDEGTWTIVDGQVAFAAAEGFVGHAVTEYSVTTDTGETATGEVRVDATWAGIAPEIALEDDSAEVPRHEDATIDVLANDVVTGLTVDAETLQLIGDDGQPTDEVTNDSGTWTVVDGQVHFEGHPRHKGETTISYVVQTADGTAGATVTVDVDQRPAAALR